MKETITAILLKSQSDLDINHISTELSKIESDKDFQYVIEYLKTERDKVKKKREQEYNKTITKESLPESCPYCGGSTVIRYGFQNGKQKFKCKNQNCHKTFIMDHRIGATGYSKQSKQRWLKFFESELNHNSLRSSAEKLGVELSTAFTMRHKYLPILARVMYSEGKFNKIVQADETFFDFNTKGNKNAGRNFTTKKYDIDYTPDYINLRESKKKHLRGKSSRMSESYSKLCVPTAINQDQSFAFSKTSNWGVPTAGAIDYAFENRLKSIDYMITDEEKAMGKFAKQSEIPILQVKKGSKIADINKVNHLHSRYKELDKINHGVSTKYLDEYLALKNFEEIYSDKTTLEKRDILFDLLKHEEKIVTYEEVRAKAFPKFIYEEKVDKKRKTYPKYLNNAIDLMNKEKINNDAVPF